MGLDNVEYDITYNFIRIKLILKKLNQINILLFGYIIWMKLL